MRILLAALLLSALAIPVLAADGLLEINQSCAATGCFPGDTANFPVTITQAGSYVLTGNLAVGTFATSAIRVDVDDVTLDLNGFTVRFTFTGGPAADGIDAATRTRVRIQDGNVIGFAGNCLSSGDNASVENVDVSGCGLDGINVGEGARVLHATASGNLSAGIRVGGSSLVSESMTFQNGDQGIYANGLSIISGNTTHDNGSTGIETLHASIVTGNLTFTNGGNGIYATNTATITGNTAYDNGDALADDGIDCALGCNVHGNAVRGNSGYGIRLNTGSGYRENVVTDNAVGGVGGAGADAGANVINGVVTSTP